MNILLCSCCLTVLLQTAATQYGKGKSSQSLDDNIVDTGLDCNITEKSRHRTLDSNFTSLHTDMYKICFMTLRCY